eukprot:COSAG06_NODE_6280_length_3001_cov_2.106134_5_plen_58_part_00
MGAAELQHAMGELEQRNAGVRPRVSGLWLVRKTPFLSHVYVKTIILPRQARDKHGKS